MPVCTEEGDGFDSSRYSSVTFRADPTAGVFRLNGVLVGTHAFRCYSSVLGVRFDAELAATSDLDLAQDRTLAVAVDESSSAALGRLSDCWRELIGRGKRWEAGVRKAGRTLPDELWSRFEAEVSR